MKTIASLFLKRNLSIQKSTLTGIALYYYPKSVLPLIKQYIAKGNNPDQPGRLVQLALPANSVLRLAAYLGFGTT